MNKNKTVKGSRFDIPTLIKMGYCRTSNTYYGLSRIDRPDWKEVMSNFYGPLWLHRVSAFQAADQYRRVCSKDNLYAGDYETYKRFPSSADGPTEYIRHIPVSRKEEDLILQGVVTLSRWDSLHWHGLSPGTYYLYYKPKAEEFVDETNGG